MINVRSWSQDGRILHTLDDKARRDLENKILKYDNNIRVTMEKDKAMRDRHSDSKSKVQKFQLALKAAQRNAQIAALVVKKRKAGLASSASSSSRKGPGKSSNIDRPLPRVKDVMGALERLADKRREAHNTKKSGQITSTWLQTHPKLPDTLKKSVWRRMHRRKLQVVLRPSMELLCDEIRQRAAKSASESMKGLSKSAEETQSLVEEKMIRAEQLFLLSCHPEADPPAVSVPTSRSTEAWAEPGWQLDLSVPKSNRGKSNILPRADSFPVLERNLSEICSVPGRQAASFLTPSHFRPLASPLSTFAIMSSPAEIPSVLDRMPNPKDQEGDPLFMTDAELKAAYAYTPKPTTAARSNAQSRNRKPKDDNEIASTGGKPTTARRTSSAASNESKKRRNSKTEASPKKRTKQETAVAASNKPADPSKGTAKTSPKPTAVGAQAPYPKTVQAQGAVANPLLAHANHQSRSNPSNATQQQARQQQQSTPQRQQSQARGKTSQIQTQQQMRPSNTSQQNYASPHQQQMAQLRMMQQGRPGQAAYQPPPPGGMQQMQQFYNPMNHSNGQYRPAMSPAPMGRMQPGAGRGVPMPMHPMPGTGGMPGTRPMQPAAPMGAMPAPVTQQRGGAPNTGSNSRQMQQQQASPSVVAPSGEQQQKQQQQQNNDQSQKDQNDPLFMLK